MEEVNTVNNIASENVDFSIFAPVDSEAVFCSRWLLCLSTTWCWSRYLNINLDSLILPSRSVLAISLDDSLEIPLCSAFFWSSTMCPYPEIITPIIKLVSKTVVKIVYEKK